MKARYTYSYREDISRLTEVFAIATHGQRLHVRELDGFDQLPQPIPISLGHRRGA
jgi:hypothetical protein